MHCIHRFLSAAFVLVAAAALIATSAVAHHQKDEAARFSEALKKSRKAGPKDLAAKMMAKMQYHIRTTTRKDLKRFEGPTVVIPLPEEAIDLAAELTYFNGRTPVARQYKVHASVKTEGQTIGFDVKPAPKADGVQLTIVSKGRWARSPVIKLSSFKPLDLDEFWRNPPRIDR